MKSRPCSLPATSSSMPAGARFAVRLAVSRSPDAQCCSLWSGPSPRLGRPTSPGIISLSAFSRRAPLTSRTGRGSASSSAACAPALRPLARIEATRRGFALAPINAPAVVVLAPPIDGPAGSILALLEGGESWSTSALARALGSSQRTVQRTLRQLEEAAALRAVGRGRSRRWLAPALDGFATTLLLPGALTVG
jgi:DNA-binding transcriptional ArsR family regulator